MSFDLTTISLNSGWTAVDNDTVKNAQGVEQDITSADAALAAGIISQATFDSISSGSDSYGDGEEAQPDDELNDEQLALANQYAAAMQSAQSEATGFVEAIKSGISSIKSLLIQAKSALTTAERDYNNTIDDKIDKIVNNTKMNADAKEAALQQVTTSTSFNDSTVLNIYSQASMLQGGIGSNLTSLQTANSKLNSGISSLDGVVTGKKNHSFGNTLSLGKSSLTANESSYSTYSSESSNLASEIQEGIQDVSDTKMASEGLASDNVDSAIDLVKSDAVNQDEDNKNGSKKDDKEKVAA